MLNLATGAVTCPSISRDAAWRRKHVSRRRCSHDLVLCKGAARSPHELSPVSKPSCPQSHQRMGTCSLRIRRSSSGQGRVNGINALADGRRDHDTEEEGEDAKSQRSPGLLSLRTIGLVHLIEPVSLEAPEADRIDKADEDFHPSSEWILHNDSVCKTTSVKKMGVINRRYG